MPLCVQLGASDFGSTSDLADPEDMPILRYRSYLPILKTMVRGGSYAFSLLTNDGFVVPAPFKAVKRIDQESDNYNRSAIPLLFNIYFLRFYKECYCQLNDIMYFQTITIEIISEAYHNLLLNNTIIV